MLRPEDIRAQDLHQLTRLGRLAVFLEIVRFREDTLLFTEPPEPEDHTGVHIRGEIARQVNELATASEDLTIALSDMHAYETRRLREEVMLRLRDGHPVGPEDVEEMDWQELLAIHDQLVDQEQPILDFEIKEWQMEVATACIENEGHLLHATKEADQFRVEFDEAADELENTLAYMMLARSGLDHVYYLRIHRKLVHLAGPVVENLSDDYDFYVRSLSALLGEEAELTQTAVEAVVYQMGWSTLSNADNAADRFPTAHDFILSKLSRAASSRFEPGDELEFAFAIS